MARSDRPLSPHLSVYRWQLHMFMSILHRATGVFLGLGFLGFAWGVMSVASGPGAFGTFMSAAAHPLGRLVLFGFSYSLVYHALNGIRHLWWDAGHGYDLGAVRTSGWFVMIGSVALTLGLWWFGYHSAGLV